MAGEEKSKKTVSDEIADLLGQGASAQAAKDDATAEGKAGGEEDGAAEGGSEGAEGSEGGALEEEAAGEDAGDSEGDDTSDEEAGDVASQLVEGDEGSMEDESSEEETDPLALLQGQIASLNEKIAEISGSKREKKVEQEVVDEVVELPTEDFMLTEEVYEAAMSSREAFNNVLVDVAKKATTYAIRAMLKKVPAIVSAQVDNAVSNQDIVGQFFQKNRDLLPARKFVSYVYTELRAEHPDKSDYDLLQMTAVEARKRMGNPTGRPFTKKTGATKGSFAPAGRGVAGRGVSRPKAPKSITEELELMAKL